MAHLRTALLILVVMTLAGCDKRDPAPSGSKPAPNTDASAPAKKGAIGYSALTLTNPFFQTIADHMTAEAAKSGYEVIVASGEQNVTKQSEQVDDFIAKGVKAIVLNPCDSKSIGPAIKKANDAGIPVFTNDLAYAGSDAKVECHIATDNHQGGKLAGEAMLKLLGEAGGKVGIIDYPPAESCQLRVKGFTEVIEAHNASTADGKIQIVAKLDGGGAREKGYAAAKDIIEANPDLAAIFAINDPSGLGAYRAVSEKNKTDQIKIIAFDAERDGKQAILEGKIVCDPVQFPDKMGVMTVQMIMKYFAGEEVPTEVLIPSQLYYQEDAKNDPALKEPAA